MENWIRPDIIKLVSHESRDDKLLLSSSVVLTP